MKGRILVAEDDRKQAELMRMYLERDGFAVLTANDGRRALELARQKEPDLILLDVMMPNVDGHDVCRVLRYESDVPIIMVTARSTEDDLLLGLDLGADDYITKPYSPRELVARVRTRIRRDAIRHPDVDVISIGALDVDVARHEVRVDGEAVEITAKEFAVLEVLARNKGRAYSRMDLIHEAFGFEYEGLERTVDVHVMNLRKKIEADPTDPRYIETVYGVGYRMGDGPD